MKFVLLFSLFCVLFAATTARVVSDYFTSPNYPGKCVDSDKVFSPGEEDVVPFICGKRICKENGLLEFHFCDNQQPPYPYKFDNFTTPYPQCCEEVGQLQVEVFFETFNEGSSRFIRNELTRAMLSKDLLRYTDLVFIPYGKADVQTDPITNIADVHCPNGQEQCDLNAMIACIVEQNTIQEQYDMIYCLLEPYDLDKCSEAVDIDISAAKECRNARPISDILKKYGDKTSAIGISEVPAVAIDGVFGPLEQEDILQNFSEVFCRKYKEKFNVTLAECITDE